MSRMLLMVARPARLAGIGTGSAMKSTVNVVPGRTLVGEFTWNGTSWFTSWAPTTGALAPHRPLVTTVRVSRPSSVWAPFAGATPPVDSWAPAAGAMANIVATIINETRTATALFTALVPVMSFPPKGCERVGLRHPRGSIDARVHQPGRLPSSVNLILQTDTSLCDE